MAKKENADQENVEKQCGQVIKTCRSGDVRLNLFVKQGDYGPYVEPSRPVYRYRDDEGKTCFSEYLRGKHLIHAAWCYFMAHWFVENFKANRLETSSSGAETEPETDGEEMPEAA